MYLEKDVISAIKLFNIVIDDENGGINSSLHMNAETTKEAKYKNKNEIQMKTPIGICLRQNIGINNMRTQSWTKVIILDISYTVQETKTVFTSRPTYAQRYILLFVKPVFVSQDVCIPWSDLQGNWIPLSLDKICMSKKGIKRIDLQNNAEAGPGLYI